MDSINAIQRTDLLLFSIVLNLVLIIYLNKKSYRQNYSCKLFSRIIVAATVVTILDMAAWFVNETGNTALIPVNYWSNALFLSLIGLPAAIAMSYLDYKIFGSIERSRKNFKFYLIPTYISIGFAIYNIFDNGFFFYINEANEYYRGIGVSISAGAMYVFIIGFVASLYRHKHLITGRITQSILILYFLPILGSVMQLLYYGTTFGMPFYTLALFIIFLILEKDELGKDELTGLYTRSKLLARLRYKMKTGDAFTIIMADIDDFKYINDTYGHSAGDKVLMQVAEILRLNTNIEDMVCRYGGDEFLILIECKENIGGNIISRIKNILSKYNQNIEYKLHLSYGYEYVEEPSAIAVEDLLYKVDRKMYIDKEKEYTKKETD